MTPEIAAADLALHTTWIEVSAAALRHNLSAVRSLLKPQVKFMAVVKANAYGHGLAGARVLAEAGADMLAVTTLEEGLACRDAGINTPILVFAPLLPPQIPAALLARLTLTVTSAGHAAQIAAAAGDSPAPVHLKVDTGMGRFGVLPRDAAALARQIQKAPGIVLEGIYTHFPEATAPDLTRTRLALDRFVQVLADLQKTGDRPALAHCANSAATLRLPESHLDMVRVGTLLYGQFPSPDLSGKLALESTWRLFSRVVEVKQVPAGWRLGYGGEHTSTGPTRIAVVPVGYYDGFAMEVNARSSLPLRDRIKQLRRALAGPAPRRVRFEGGSLPVVGRVGMQTMILDVTRAPAVEIGTAVEIPCRRVTSNPLLPRVLRDS